MSQKRHPNMKWPLMTEYLTKNASYKDQSRELISKALGFEPNLQVSIVPEIQLRGSVKKYQSGELSKETLDKHVNNMAKYIRSIILKRHPEQVHLVENN